MQNLEREICEVCKLKRPHKWELDSFIMNGGASGDFPKICPHPIKDKKEAIRRDASSLIKEVEHVY